MHESKIHLINKIFNNEAIRTVWDKENEKYYISIVDIVRVLTESDNPRNYWKVLKHRLKKEGNKSVTNCNQLKLKSSYGKYYRTDVWKDNGINKNSEYALLTNQIYKAWSGMTAREYKQYKGFRKESLRDNMDNTELILTDLGEEATKRLVSKKRPRNLSENMVIAKDGGMIAKTARDKLEEKLGEIIISKDNRLGYKYEDKK